MACHDHSARVLQLASVAVTLCLGGTLLAATARGASRPNAWVTTKVKIALLTTEHVDALRVHVDTIDGRVTLHGVVGSLDEKVRAHNAARSVEGVHEVTDLLRIVSPLASEAVVVSDAALKKRVNAALTSDPSLGESRIRVESVHDGVVLLSGSAATLTAHRRALEGVRRVEGVRHVASQIESPDRVADEELWREGEPDQDFPRGSSMLDILKTMEAKLRLLWNPEVPALDINVDTRHAVVTLFGIVPSESARAAAEIEVSKVTGVARIVNRLEIVPKSRRAATRLHDTEVRRTLERDLASRPDLADAVIRVDVQNGVARLVGTVRSPTDRTAALTIAQSAAGVRSTIDDLQLAEEESPAS